MSGKQLKFKGDIDRYLVRTMVMYRGKPTPSAVNLTLNCYINTGDLWEFSVNQVEVTTDYENNVLKITIDAYDPPLVYEVRESEGVEILTKIPPKED